MPPTLFKIDKSVALSVLSTGTIRLLPIRILGASAGTIRAVPDTVKKVPGLAPVVIFAKNGGKRFALAWALRAPPHFLEKIFY